MFTTPFSYDKFPRQDTDDELKVSINELVTFGDIKDASNATIRDEKNLVRETYRNFVSGEYKVTVIELSRDIDPLVIFHHEGVDPNLIAMQMIRQARNNHPYDICIHAGILSSWCTWSEGNKPPESPPGDYYQAIKKVDDLFRLRFRKGKEMKPLTVTLPNDICDGSYFNNGRYYNERYRKYGDEVYPGGTHIFFTCAEKATAAAAATAKNNKNIDPTLTNFILKKQIKRSSKIKYLFAVQNDEGENVALGVYFSPCNTQQCVYGNVFTDSLTQAGFALVVSGRLYSLDKNTDPSWTWTEKIILPQEEEEERWEKIILHPTKMTNEEELKFPTSDFILRE